MFKNALLVASLAAPVLAQQFVAELDPNPTGPFVANPRDVVAGGGRAFFTADVDGSGRELCVTDGTVLGTRVFADLQPGLQGSSPRAIGVVGASVMVQSGSNLVITDGTPAGTRTLSPGVDTLTTFRWFGSVGARFVWAERGQGSSLFSLRASDGTAAGTVFLATCSDVTGAVVRNNQMLLLVATIGAEVLSTDGLTATSLATLPVAPRSSFATLLGHDYFLVDDGALQTVLWRTDGTAPGTTSVASLGPTQGTSSIATLNGQLVIGACNQLWTSNGTAPGTAPVPVAVQVVRSLSPAGSVLCFSNGSALTGGPQLWRTDGTAAGTFALDTRVANYSSFAVTPTRTFCFARDDVPPRLVRTDGTLAGTVSVPIVDNGAFTSIAALGNDAIATTTFGVQGANTGLHAWRTDATTVGSLQLTPSTAPAGIQAAGRGAALESTLFFPAATSALGYELWRTDGTPAGTQLVQDFAPGPASGVNSVLPFAGAVWIAAGNGIWRHDGGPGGSVLALQPDPAATGAALILAQDDYLLFRTSSVSGNKLWRSDGTPLGTLMLESTGVFQLVTALAQLGDTTFWTRLDFSSVRLVRADGTPTGRVDLGPSTSWLSVLGDRVLFVRQAAGTFELYSLTETATTPQFVATVPFAPSFAYAAGSRLVCISANGTAFATDGIATVTPLPLPTVTAPRFAADGFVYTATFSATTGTSLWRTDGTVAGTGPAIAFGTSGLGSVLEAEALGSGNRIFLNASDGTSGAEPWISAGTQGTTALLADLEPNGNSSPQLIGIAGERAYVVAFDAVRGRELWSFDLAAAEAANAQPFGQGCPGTLGVPRLRVDWIAAVGRTISLRIERGAPSSIQRRRIRIWPSVM
ncbi:MAG: hypothetical protein ABL997_14900 [Planctomycetota bacterium]